MRVEDVAVPKSEIVAVPVTIPLPDLVEEFRESARTRIPVYEGTLDQPIGVVNLKDVALRHGFGQGGEFHLRDLLRPLLYVPPSMPVGALLQKMQAERIHMALVIDEYGGTDGLCTIEDLLETVVGEIEDEHDLEEPKLFSREAEGVWVADGATPIEEFEKEIGLDLTKHEEIDAEEVDTLGGLVFLLAGHVAQKGEVVVHPDGPLFEVLDADGRRIKRLRVRLPAEPR
jgi:magnesium and cobalt transporter